MAATLKEIAKLLGVSKSTVSRALKNHPRIGLQMREKVQKLAIELDYAPNATAINLKTKQTRVIGVLVPDVTLHFFSLLISGMEAEAQKRNYNLMICQSGEDEKQEQTQIQNLTRANVDGILISISKQTSDIHFYKKLAEKKFPFVFVSRYLEGFSGVISNDVNGAKAMTKHLLERGCRRIAHIGGPKFLLNTKDRLNGYAETLREKGLSVDESLIVYTNMERESNIEAISKLWQHHEKPDAIFCFNDYVAFDCVQFLKEKGIEVGKTMKISGFGNQPVAGYMEPSLTTVDQQAYEMGKKAVDLLLKNMEQLPQSPSLHVLDTKLVVRSSS